MKLETKFFAVSQVYVSNSKINAINIVGQIHFKTDLSFQFPQFIFSVFLFNNFILVRTKAQSAMS